MRSYNESMGTRSLTDACRTMACTALALEKRSSALTTSSGVARRLDKSM